MKLKTDSRKTIFLPIADHSTFAFAKNMFSKLESTILRSSFMRNLVSVVEFLAIGTVKPWIANVNGLWAHLRFCNTRFGPLICPHSSWGSSVLTGRRSVDARMEAASHRSGHRILNYTALRYRHGNPSSRMKQNPAPSQAVDCSFRPNLLRCILWVESVRYHTPQLHSESLPLSSFGLSSSGSLSPNFMFHSSFVSIESSRLALGCWPKMGVSRNAGCNHDQSRTTRPIFGFWIGVRQNWTCPNIRVHLCPLETVLSAFPLRTYLIPHRLHLNVMNLQIFSLFPGLPLEIRLAVWYLAITPRVVNITPLVNPHGDPRQQENPPCYGYATSHVLRP